MKINWKDKKQRERAIIKAKFMLFKLRLSQKETAAALDVTPQLISRWVKEFGWKDDLTKKSVKAVDNVKFDDSLSAFVAFARVRFRNDHETVIRTIYEEFISYA